MLELGRERDLSLESLDRDRRAHIGRQPLDDDIARQRRTAGSE
jgi:hypothetical protein